MKGFMKMLEDIMVAIAFAEEGVSVSLLQQKTSLDKGLGERAWDLK